jgi:hypothetical protein
MTVLTGIDASSDINFDKQNKIRELSIRRDIS